jgi:hypothetical protein
VGSGLAGFSGLAGLAGFSGLAGLAGFSGLAGVAGVARFGGLPEPSDRSASAATAAAQAPVASATVASSSPAIERTSSPWALPLTSQCAAGLTAAPWLWPARLTPKRVPGAFAPASPRPVPEDPRRSFATPPSCLAPTSAMCARPGARGPLNELGTA